VTDNTSLISQIYALPIGVRALIWLGILACIAWPLLMPIVVRLIALLLWCFRGMIKVLYIMVSWTILTRLHKRKGGVFAKINNTITDILGAFDKNLEKYCILFNQHRNRHMSQIIVVYFIIVALIALPDILNLEENAALRAIQTFYVQTEYKVLGEPVPIDSLATHGEASPSKPIIKVTGIKKNSSLNIWQNADTSSKSLCQLSLGDSLYYLGKILKSDGEEWVQVETIDGIIGWVRKKYVDGIPD